MGTNRPKASELRIVMRGSHADIRMIEKIFEEYSQAIEGNQEFSVKLGRHLARYFTEFCNNVDYNKRLGEEKFKKEENLPDGNGRRQGFLR